MKKEKKLPGYWSRVFRRSIKIQEERGASPEESVALARLEISKEDGDIINGPSFSLEEAKR